MTGATRASTALALAWGATVGVGGYALVRIVQFFLYPDPDPAMVVWSAHAGFYWRCWTCVYAGGLASFVAFTMARLAPAAVARALGVGIVAVASLLALQVAVFP